MFAELDWPREAAGAGWVDWQLWAHTSKAYDAGDRATISARLYLPAAQRGEFLISSSVISLQLPLPPPCCSLCLFLLIWAHKGIPPSVVNIISERETQPLSSETNPHVVFPNIFQLLPGGTFSLQHNWHYKRCIVAAVIRAHEGVLWNTLNKHYAVLWIKRL